MIRRIVLSLATVTAALLTSPQALAQGFPSRPLNMVVPYAAGGSADVLGRVLAQKMGEDLGQNVLVELKPGASGNLGAEQVAKIAKADGYTFLFASISLATSVSLMKLNFDPRKDLVPVAGVAAIPSLMVVSAESPFRSVNDVIAAAKTRPGELTFGSAGNGTGSHLAGEFLAALAGVKMTHVPYKGSGAVYPDLIAQRITMAFDVMGSSSVQVKGGKVKALAITSGQRSKAFPDVPTIAELGYPVYEFGTWFGFFAPAATPAEAVARLERAVLHALQTDAVKERLAFASAEPISPSRADFGKYYNADVERWARLVREGKIAPLQ